MGRTNRRQKIIEYKVSDRSNKSVSLAPHRNSWSWCLPASRHESHDAVNVSCLHSSHSAMTWANQRQPRWRSQIVVRSDWSSWSRAPPAGPLSTSLFDTVPHNFWHELCWHSYVVMNSMERHFGSSSVSTQCFCSHRVVAQRGFVSPVDVLFSCD